MPNHDAHLDAEMLKLVRVTAVELAEVLREVLQSRPLPMNYAETQARNTLVTFDRQQQRH